MRSARAKATGLVAGLLALSTIATYGPAPRAGAATATFSNTAAVSLGDGTASRATALPYPTTIVVSGMSGVISDLDMSLFGLDRPRPADFDALLVGPTGVNLRVISDVGGGQGNNFTNATIVLTDGAVAMPSNGNVGSGSYAPTNYGGTDSFPAPAPAPSVATALAAFNGTNPNGTWSLYILDDSGNADAGTISGGWSLTFTTVTSAPVATNDSYSTSEDTVLNIAVPGVLGNDTDADGDSLTAVLNGGPSHGTLTFNTNGGFTYTPQANYSGPDSFTYRASDGSNISNLATVTIDVVPVNDAPVAVDDSASTSEDTAVTVAVLANDSDGEGQPLAPVVVTPPAHGSVVVNGDGTVTYTPDANFNGTDTFTYQASDGSAASNVATVTISVGSTNDAPVATADGYATPEDTALVVAAPGVLANDSDVDGDPLTAALVSGPSHGTLALGASGSVTYTPNADFTGTDTFTYQASDGSATSNVATVTITVGSTNDAPSANDGSVVTPEDTPVAITLTGSDPDGDSLTFTVLSGPASGVLSGSGTNLIYTPNANVNGPDGFTFQVCDSGVPSLCATGTISITVSPANDAPTAADDAYSTNEDTALAVTAAGVLTNDGDVDGDALAAILDSGPAHGTVSLHGNGGFVYTPVTDFNGTDTFTYHASDGSASSPVATVTITVLPVNDLPTADDDAATTPEDTAVTVAVLANDSDPDGDTLTPAVVDTPAHGTAVVNGDGTIAYTPTAGFEGTDTFTYEVSDGSGTSNVATVTITVTHVNHAPDAVDDDVATAAETAVTFDVLSNDTDPDADTLSQPTHADPNHGTASCIAGTCVYTPAAGYSGADSFTYTIDDGNGATDVATVRVVVTPPDDPEEETPEPTSTTTTPPAAAPLIQTQPLSPAARAPVVSTPLVRTGISATYLVSLGLALVGSGWVLTRITRRRAG